MKILYLLIFALFFVSTSSGQSPENDCNYSLGVDYTFCVRSENERIWNSNEPLDTLFIRIPENSNVIQIQWNIIGQGKFIGYQNKHIVYLTNTKDIDQAPVLLIGSIQLRRCTSVLIDTIAVQLRSLPEQIPNGYVNYTSCADTVRLGQAFIGIRPFSSHPEYSVQWQNLNGLGHIMYADSSEAVYIPRVGSESSLVIIKKQSSYKGCAVDEFVYLTLQSKPTVFAGKDIWIQDSTARNNGTQIRFPSAYTGNPLSTLYRWSHTGSGFFLHNNRDGMVYRAHTSDYDKGYVTITLQTNYCESIQKDSFLIFLNPTSLLQPQLPRILRANQTIELSLNTTLGIPVQSCYVFGDHHQFIEQVEPGDNVILQESNEQFSNGVIYLEYHIQSDHATIVVKDSILTTKYHPSTSPIALTTLSKMPSASLSLYPNPCLSAISFSLPSSTGIAAILFTHTLGKQHIKTDVSCFEDHYTCSVDDLSQGVYLVEIITKEGIRYYSKVVKE